MTWSKTLSCHARRTMHPTYDDRYRRRVFQRGPLRASSFLTRAMDRACSSTRTRRWRERCTWHLLWGHWWWRAWQPDCWARTVTSAFPVYSRPCHCSERCSVRRAGDRWASRRLGWPCRWCERRECRLERGLKRVIDSDEGENEEAME